MNYSVIKVIIVVITLIQVNALFAFDIDGLSYTVTSEEDKTCSVVQSSVKPTGEVVIPNQVKYEDKTYTVTDIEEYAFYGCIGLTSISIPESVTGIGNYAFQYCI